MAYLLVMEYSLIISPRRGETVTRKITRGLSQIKQVFKISIFGKYRCYRDWGHAKDYVEIQWKILQQAKPEDFVIATGRRRVYEHL